MGPKLQKPLWFLIGLFEPRLLLPLTAGKAAVNHEIILNRKKDILVYNRVPKCGSIWMTRLLYLLGAGDQNKYKVESPYEPGEKPWLTIPQEKTVVDHLTKAEKPTVYIRHQECLRN